MALLQFENNVVFVHPKIVTQIASFIDNTKTNWYFQIHLISVVPKVGSATPGGPRDGQKSTKSFEGVHGRKKSLGTIALYHT